MVSAFSIGTAKRDSTNKNFVPAPNAYSINNQATSPQWTIGGQGKREVRIKSFTPGPGQYPQKSSLYGVPCCTIKGRLKEKVVSQSPGPGNYKEDSFQTVQKRIPSYSMGVKIDKIIKNFVPGPGTYDMNQTYLTTNSSKFPIEKRLNTMDDSSNSPGPGQYNLTNHSKFSPHKSQPSWGFGSKNNFKIHQSLDMSSPGPGMYELKSTLTQQSFTLKPKLKTQECDISIPGPGKYSPDVSFTKTTLPVFKMGKEPRIKQQKINLDPGPGKYYSENYDSKSKKTQPCYSLSKANRNSMVENETQFPPGPGTYDIPPQKLGNITLKGAKVQSRPQAIPGPGTYNPEDKLCYSYEGSVKIVKDIKQTKAQSSDKIPGPGTYEYKNILMGPSWGFGKSNKRKPIQNINNSPGPAAYDLPSKFADVPKYLNCKSKFQV
ncbi:unnamed protein product [Paramecium sonneborni]|uniref:Uncharacterized protein n=1 Tax=Paramecium sonneborni TaxID=65129 RepID=A0A8S1N8D1_9CILI|nr:unnamed protein product [Paramecium sonneborni]